MSANINYRAEKMLDSLAILKQFNESFKSALIEEYGEEVTENIVNERRYADALNTLVSYVETHVGRSIVGDYLK